ncbi:ribosome small subunit-dependent GTPase A [Thiocapsa imhoffii]|uniref:Small ribosomal subunit biogenesis GTPase RsgA n=1 Tax=Thiocapsa imhoffii TaxID=382777 RepID=A0A9X1B8Z8_9GAMM|nr:ribosome small subunit-dependent GTPase A [Thiocapsa imhoffii]MBK1645332.1 ribosome small subunit-dependent GTPase A [Thiocapsa imhoffii]
MPKRRLSGRQIERIQTIQDRRRQRLATRLDAAASDLDTESLPPARGRIVVRHGGHLAVEDEAGQIIHCRARQNLGHPVCGDHVVWHHTADQRGIVTAILPRDSLLSRPDFSGRDKPLAANLTQLAIVIAPRPEPSDYLVDQYLVAAEMMGVRAIILGTKMDLLSADEQHLFQARFAHYAEIGYPLTWISLRAAGAPQRLLGQFAGHTSILVGQSGVGKSSLIDVLLPDRGIQIGRLSQATGLGRHTTSAATLYRLGPGAETGGALIDSPGVRSFRLGIISRENLQQGFRELRPHLERCRFTDCRHDQEPDCGVQAALAAGLITPQRLNNFRHLLAESEQSRN